jgi:hypothetical protein
MLNEEEGGKPPWLIWQNEKLLNKRKRKKYIIFKVSTISDY